MKFVVRGRVLEWDTKVVRPANPGEAPMFWSVYFVEADGCLEWVEDLPNKEEAERAAVDMQAGFDRALKILS